MSTPHVCVMGAYRPHYPRNLILRRGLALHGAAVVECRAPMGARTPDRARALYKKFPPLADQCDVILLAEFNNTLAWTAARLARRYGKRLVIDAFTSAYDSAVHDRGTAANVSLSALRYWIIDFIMVQVVRFSSSHRLITDTNQHCDYFVRAFGAPAGRLGVVPVGASHEWFNAPPVKSAPRLLVQFFGSYIPLHGIETILQTVHRLQHRADIAFELIGGGQVYDQMRALADRLSLPGAIFREWVPEDELPAEVTRADICLGIFGTTDKAARVIPNKVYQTLASGKPVITADTPAIRDAFTPGEHLLTVPPGDAEALIDAITRLADDAALRARLSAAGQDRMRTQFDEAAIGRKLLEAIA